MSPAAVSIEDLARPRTSAISEEDLLAGYAGDVIRRQCACGGWIYSRATDKAIYSAVMTHNEGPRHEAWAAQNGWQQGGRRW